MSDDGRLRGWRRRVLVAVAMMVAALGAGLPLTGTATASPAPVSPKVPDGSTTTTGPPPTTTAPPVTTTTAPPVTTTTTVPSTTSTHPTTTTTTVPKTTTTTSPASKSTSKGTPVGLIVLIVVLVLAIILVIILLRRRQKKGVEAEWHRAVVPALSDAQLARDAILSDNAMSEDSRLRGAVEVQAERAAAELERVVQAAPDPHAAGLATEAAAALRGLAFAVEADRLLRHGASAPSGVQLAQADEARRARNAELSAALARLSTSIGSAPRSRRAP